MSRLSTLAAMRRRALLIPLLLALAVAGCGGGKSVTATPQTVEGTVKTEGAGKGLFAANGCNACHTYKPAGSKATIGPDLDKLEQYAKRANQPLDQFTHESIVNPNAYVEKGYPKGVMPNFGSLSKDKVDALVEFLTKPA